MEKTLQVLNSLESEEILQRYAIGGAMGATFYVEPLLTYDLDVFVLFPEAGLLLTLEPLYQALRDRGYHEEAECVMIEGVPVQFLPAYNSLLEEALRDALETMYEQTPARVLRAEHPVAICVQTGREKDRQRVRVFMEQAQLDADRMTDILKRHQLDAKFRSWTQ